MIDGIYRLSGGELDLLEEYGDTSNVTYAWDSEQHGNYYVTLKNTSSSSRTAQLTMADIPSVSVGSDGSAETTVTFDGEHYSYIRFTDLPAGNYIFDVEDAGSVDFRIWDENFDVISCRDFGNFCTFSCTGMVLFQVKSQYTGAFTVSLTKGELEFAWTADGQIIENNTLNIAQGESVALDFLVNGQSVYNYISPDDEEEFSIDFDTNTKILEIKSDCIADGSHFEMRAFIEADLIEEIKIPDLTVIPTIKYPFEGVTIDSINNQNNITIKWENVNNLDSFILTIPGTSFSTTITVSEYPDSKYTIWGSRLPSKMPIMTFAITTVNYNWYNVELRDYEKCSIETNLSYTFNYYYGGGTGTQTDPYVILEGRHFGNIGKLTGSNIYYSLENDITVLALHSNVDLHGIFEGNENKITWSYFWTASDVYEDNDPLGNGGYAVPNYQGLFGTNYGIIKNLNVKVDFDGDPSFNFRIRQYMGGIAGRNIGTIQYCSISGDINSNMNKHVLGGIAGYNSGVVANCYNTSCEIRGAYVIGGLVGYNVGSGTVSSGRVNYVDFTLHNASYWNSADADINAIGGAVGINDGKVISCHVGSDSDGGYLRFEDMDAQTRPYAGEVIGAQKRTGASMTNCVDSGMAILDSDLTSAQRKNINKAGGGLIGNTY